MQPQSATASRPAPSTLTAQKVVEMFADMGLRVCDDAAAIKAAFEQKKSRYQQMTRSPNAHERIKGEEWFKNAGLLQNDQSERPRLLAIVFEAFATSAAATLAAANHQGTARLTQALRESLIGLARQQLQAEEPLARRFLDDFMVREKLEPDKLLAPPMPVEGLNARSGEREITLSWKLPSTSCDAVEIEREGEAGLKRGAASAAQIVYKGAGTSFRDGALEPGTRYVYRAYSLYRGARSERPARAEAVSVGEVRGASVHYDGGRVVLTWDLPGRGASAIVFKKRGGPPAVRAGAHGAPEAADSETTRVFQSAEEAWTDGDVTEGLAHHYLVVAHFGGSLYGRGVELVQVVPKAPPAPPAARAEHRTDGDKEVVTISWEPVPGGLPVEYVLVRREGAVAPTSPSDGQLQLAAVGKTRFVDQDVQVGRRYSYAVFSRLGGLESWAGAGTPPVDVLGEVRGLTTRTAPGTVELAWTTPDNVRRVVVRRSRGRVTGPSDGVEVPVANDHAVDQGQGLRNDAEYHYLVCCIYQPTGAGELISAGVRVVARPSDRPQPVVGLSVKAVGTRVEVSWQPPPAGQAVVVVRATRAAEQQAPDVKSGAAIDVARLARFGDRVPAGGGSSAIDEKPERTKPWYSVFTVSGSQAVYAGALAAIVCPDAAELTALSTADGLLLRWGWPAGCSHCRVVRRGGAWPEGPSDPKARITEVSHTDYGQAGDRYLDEAPEAAQDLFYVVYTMASGVGGAQFFSSADSPGSRCAVAWTPWTQVRYQLARRGSELTVRYHVDRLGPGFGGLVLMAAENDVPASTTQGVELGRVLPRGVGRGDVALDLGAVRSRRWRRFFCKLHVVEPEQQESTLIIHPNTSITFDGSGKAIADGDDGPRRVKAFSSGVPDTVICPECFEEFGLDDMRFTNAAGAERLPGRRPFWPRKQPPRPPKGPEGQVYNVKVCPNGHGLPFTAGLQGSLVVGLIGAKYSGKSHYVASLVQRLGGKVSNDMMAGLLPVSEQTQERYKREFHDPLFKDGLELALTTGVPAPLIYDLTFDGALWKEPQNRSVTLALYDTAGEVLDRPEAIERLARYLSIASGIMLLVDPLQTRAVRDMLPASMLEGGLPDYDDLADPNGILGRVIPQLEASRVLKEGGPLDTPVAVVLTKCDVLRDVGLIEHNRLWHTSRGHVGFFDDELHDDLSGMMAEYVQRWSPAAYHQVMRRFSRRAFFGVSATGCAPDPGTRRYRYISPWRVEEPLLWLLAEMGVIPRRRESGP